MAQRERGSTGNLGCWGGLLVGIAIGAVAVYFIQNPGLISRFTKDASAVVEPPTVSRINANGKILANLDLVRSEPAWLKELFPGRPISANDLPPVENYEIQDRCPGETCDYRHPWRALKDVPLFAGKDQTSEDQIVYTLSARETVSPLGGAWIVKTPGIVEVTAPFSIAGVALEPGDFIYPLMNLGEGWTRGVVHGKLAEFSLDDQIPQQRTRKLRDYEAVWWVQMRTSMGIVGWTNSGGYPAFDGQAKAGPVPYVAVGRGDEHDGLWDYEIELFTGGRTASLFLGESLLPCPPSEKIQKVHTGFVLQAEANHLVELKADDGEVLAKAFIQPGTNSGPLPEDTDPDFLLSRTLNGHTERVYCAPFSPDGRMLASASYDGTIKLWDVASGEELRSLRGHSDMVFFAAFSPDGKYLASASRDQTARIWNVADGTEVRILRGHRHWVHSISFSPDGSLVATGSDDDTIKLWDVETGDQVRTLSGHRWSVMTVAFSPDGKYLASGGLDKSIIVWEVGSGKEVYGGIGHNGAVLSVTFSSDGKYLASASADHSAKIWNTTTRKVERSLSAPAEVNSVAFSPMGRYLAGACFDGTVIIWNVSTGREVAVLKGSTKRMFGVSFSPNGEFLAAASEDTAVRLWKRE